MKNLKLIMLLLFVHSGVNYAQTADSILKKYTELSGGQTNWDKVNSLKVTGTAKLISQGMELPFVRIMESNGKQRTSLKINGMDYVAIAFNGDQAWGSNGQMQPEMKDSDETENTKSQINDFPFPGFNWKERGYQAEFIGEELINNTNTYKIKLTKTPQLVDGKTTDNISFMFINKKTYLPVLLESLVLSGPYAGQTMKSYLSDYRSVEGLMYPFEVTMKYEEETFQILESNTVEWNTVIEPSIYLFPKS